MWGRLVLSTVVLGLSTALLVSGCTGDSGAGGSTPNDSSPATSAPATSSADDRPGWIVSLGDSYISGEGARWGANGSGPLRRTDALGPDAYFDRDGQESEPGCHRASRTVVVPRIGGLLGKNFACSGATTRSDSSGLRFKPGIDFAHETDGDGIGQTLSLQRFAATHRVAAVVVSIGGNDVGFGTIAGRCVTDNLATAGGTPEYCSDDADLNARFGPAAQRRVAAEVAAALSRVDSAMRRAGYAERDYRRILFTYPSPIPPGDLLRSTDAERGGLGCPLFARDATWANQVVLPAITHTVTSAAARASAPYEVLDLSAAFDGHRLCERGTVRLPDETTSSWHAGGAVDAVEWVNAVYRTIAPHQVQESLHPNYWGTAAERACLRLTLAGPERPGHVCTQQGPGLHDGDPVMALGDDGD
jgi:hypothetical protein